VDFDGVRRKYLTALHDRTQRNTIIYYTDWVGGTPGPNTIVLEDMQGMMEVVQDLKGPKLDLLLHSPGGSAEAAASIVRYLRKQFDEIRVFVPLVAMSAATMWALACDVIVMGKHSQLGPIDPQLLTANGAVPARAIIEQFERAQDETSEDPSKLGAWMPILQQYAPALLEQCADQEALARRLVTEWLSAYMLKGELNPGDAAEKVARFFADYGMHRSHSLGIDRDQARDVGVHVEDLEADPALQDAVLSVHHAAMHTTAAPAMKLIENHLGRTFAKVKQQIMIGPQIGPAPPGLAQPGP
jgi:hypothetical protein